MKRIAKEEIREMSLADLIERIEREEGILTKKKFSHAVSMIENPLELRWIRRDIARLKTELTKRKKLNNNING